MRWQSSGDGDDVSVMDEFLTPADVACLTGKAQAKLQCAELDRRRIPYILGARGRPQVSRHHARMIALGQALMRTGLRNLSA